MDDWKTMVYACESMDGGVSIIVPALHYEGTEEEWLELNELTRLGHYLRLYPIQLPGDRYFREAWRLGKETIEIDLEAAKEIHLNNLRQQRNKRLAELDIEAIRSYESCSEEKLDRVIRLKEDLRKMPEDFALNVDNVEDLRHEYPSCLSDRL